MPTVTGDRCRKFVSWIALRGNKQHGCFVFKENCDDCAHGKPPKERNLVAAGNCLRSDCLRRYGFAAHGGLCRATRHRKSRLSIGYLRATAGECPSLAHSL